MKILLIEDDPDISTYVTEGLNDKGFSVDTCENGEEGHSLAARRDYQLVILDIVLPDLDGLSILRRMRNENITTPVILLSALSGIQDRVKGLDLGADDYVTKPFYVEELIARIHAIIRRSDGKQNNILAEGHVSVNLITRKAWSGNKIINLTLRELALLELFMRSPGRIFSRTEILEHIWGYNFDPQTNIVDVYVSHLRNKLDLFSDAPIIENIRGVGYRFVTCKKEGLSCYA